MPDLSVWPTDGGDGSVSSEARWRKMARGWVPSGVATGLLDTGGPAGLVPTLVAGPTINVSPGACWLDGHYAELVTAASVPATANGLLVVRFTPADNHAELLYRDAATVCTMTLATWELPIAQMVAGALRDVRWFANSMSELAYIQSTTTVTLTGSHTAASPNDIDVIPAVYCDGSPLEVSFSGLMSVAPAGGLVTVAVWVDNAVAPPAAGGDAQAKLAVSYSVQNAPGYGRFRIQPAAGVHQIRSRGYLAGGGTSGAVNVYHSLAVRRT